MTKEFFLQLLKKSSVLSYSFAKNYVVNELPEDFKYSVELNVSYDDPSLTQFDMYPNENDTKILLINELEVVELLCRNGKVPVWIDISVDCVYKNKTIFNLECAGRYSDDEKEFYYNRNDTGPFGIKGPTFPIGYIDGKKFKLKSKYKMSLFSWFKNKFLKN